MGIFVKSENGYFSNVLTQGFGKKKKTQIIYYNCLSF